MIIVLFSLIDANIGANMLNKLGKIYVFSKVLNQGSTQC